MIRDAIGLILARLIFAFALVFLLGVYTLSGSCPPENLVYLNQHQLVQNSMQDDMMRQQQD